MKTKANLIQVGVVVALLAASFLLSEKVPLGVILQGAILGAGTGLLGMGLVLVYRSARIVNFAYGSMGGLAAAVGVSLYLGRGWPWPLAIAAALIVGVGVGVIVERLVIRRFTTASPLTLTVATIGLAQVLGGIEFLVPRLIGGPSLVGSFPTALSSITVTVHPVIISGNDLLLLGSVPIVLAALTWFLLRTEAGIAVRGVADNRERAQLLGIPVDKLSTLVWGITGALAALTIMLKSPSEGLVLDVAAGPTLLLPALAAAIVAGLEDLPTAFKAGIGLGILDQLVRWNVGKQSTTSLVFLGIILLALMIKRRSGDRANTGGVWSSAAPLRLPPAVAKLAQVRVTRWIGGVMLAGAALALPIFATSSLLNRVSAGLILGIVVVSIVLLTGWGGSVSLGQFAIAGIAGLAAANLISRTHMDIFLTLAIAAAVGAVVAVIVGLPGLRLDGLFLAVTTLAFAVAVDAFVLNPTNFREAIPDSFSRPMLWSRFDLNDERVFYLFCLGALALSVLVVSRLRRVRSGRVLLAARDNDRAAAAAGIPTTRIRLAAFVVAGLLAGLAGGLEANLLGGVGYHTFEPAESLLLFSMAVIGGIESLGGALLGVALVEVASYLFPDYQLVITGTGLLLMLILLPRGLGHIAERANFRLQLALAKLRGIDIGDAELSTGSAALPSKPRPDASILITRPTTDPGPGVPLPGVPVTASAQVTGAASAPAPLLECDGVQASYGPLKVLFGIDLVVHEGEIVALLGTNGAGKSTLLRSITGLMKVDQGSVRFGGQKLNGQTPEQIAQSGVALMPGGRGLFASLTVEENLRLATWMLRKDPAAAKAERTHVTELLPLLKQRLDIRAGLLSGGEQQMLSMAMALSTRPKVLCIDELSLGLAPTVVADLVQHVKKIHQAGTTVVLVEQSVNVALMLAERAIFIEKGQVNFSGPTKELLERPDVLRAVFVGGPDKVAAATTGATTGATAPAIKMPSGLGATRARSRRPATTLECRDLTKRYGGITAVNQVSLMIEPGMILGVIGHNGAGKTTLFDLISGFQVPTSGRVLLGGEDVSELPAHRRAIAGLGRSFQEARLYPSLTVAETVTVALDQHLANRDPVAGALRLDPSIRSEKKARRQALQLLELLGLLGYRDQLTSELSTGTRRIVEIACVLAQQPSVVLLDEPSAGVAQRETEALGPLLRQIQTYTGSSLVIIEHDMNLMTNLCDELVALELGTVITRGLPKDVLDHPEVIASYLGTDETTIHRSGPGAGHGTSAPAGDRAGPGTNGSGPEGPIESVGSITYL